MDPLTQGVFGSIAGQALADKHSMVKASVVGGLAGMAPDLDVLIQSSKDSLLFLEYHRHFTHSLLFVPIGGAICALFFYLSLGKYWGFSFRQALLWSLLGFATHGLLDACTSYGTRLLWPLSSERFAWDLVSVIDPLFSAVLFFVVVTALVFRKRAFTLVAVLWISVYLSLAVLQHQRALHWAERLVANRGHEAIRLHAKPSFGNIAVWKTLYEYNGLFYVDAVKPGISKTLSWQGESIAKLNKTRDLPWLDLHSQQSIDIERFRAFSADFIAIDPENPDRIADIRYSLLPNRVIPLWGIALSRDAGPRDHAHYFTQRDGSREALPTLLEMIRE